MNTKLKNEIKKLIKKTNLSCSIKNFKNKANFDVISAIPLLSEDFIREFQNKLDWYLISSYQKLSEDFIREFKDKVDWLYIFQFQILSEDFIREFKDKATWTYIIIYQRLSENFIKDFMCEFRHNNEICRNISSHQPLSENFIREFQNYLNWDYLSEYQKLSEDFIREFQNKVDWIAISKHQKLSENFIREFQDKVDWSSIYICQQLSESFIEEFQYYIDIYYLAISKYQKVSSVFRKKYKIKIKKDCWLYKDEKFKREQILKTNKYEIIDGNIIAYKGIRNDNYSKYNFQYKYEVGKTYYSNCDCNIENKDSFGLSAWTLDDAKKYCKEKIIKVQIPIDKLGCIIQNGNKLRCFEFKVLEIVEEN